MRFKSLFLSILIIAAIASMYFPFQTNAAGGIPSADLMSNTGIKDLATGTLTVTTTASTSIGTLPSGCHAVEVYTDNDLNYGSGDVPTGTNSPYIPAGTSKVFYAIDSANPTIYFRGRATTCTVTLIGGYSISPSISSVTTASGVVDVKNVESVDLIDRLASGLVDIKNVESVDLIDRLASGLVDVKNVESVDLIDRLASGLVDVKNVESIDLIDALSSGVVDVKNVESIDEIDHLASGMVDIGHIEDGHVQADATAGFKAVAATIVTTFATTQTAIGTLPAGSRFFAIYVPAEGTAIQYGPSDVGSLTHPNIAAGGLSPWFSTSSLTPSTYITTRGTTATATILAR